MGKFYAGIVFLNLGLASLVLRIFSGLKVTNTQNTTATHTSLLNGLNEVSKPTLVTFEVYPPTGTTRKETGTTKNHSTTGSSHTSPAHENPVNLVSANGKSKNNNRKIKIKYYSSACINKIFTLHRCFMFPPSNKLLI